ncbi:Aerobactin siderophore biosynthesis protein iucb [Neofusicoccum parvum]|uniref:Aerobactin siderophore biosynthesis protein iucb n=1 Tax=Neofusicoccum parvum TaxID=310453 RepID=A0ACB5SMD6_9PEZI|nr:Aerobactin siderophore biosynthesis protein iucb [Neofusicoccum parvum]
MAKQDSQPSLPMQLRLPHPWYTSYTIEVAAFDEGLRQFHIQPSPRRNGETLHAQLHKDDLLWTEPKFTTSATDQQDHSPHFWTRPESIPISTLFWTQQRPSIGQTWLAAYGLLSLYPRLDSILITLRGANAAEVGKELCRVGLLVADPSITTQHRTQPTEYFLFRGSFWQGAGSPFGSRPAWLATSSTPNTWEYPPLPLHPAPSTSLSAPTPIRAPKPTPGTTLYSRFLAPLSQHLTLRALDPSSATDLDAFLALTRHGTRAHHAARLAAAHADPAVLPVLACLGAAPPQAYFELYWVRERVCDHVGAHYDAGPFDRGVGVLLREGAGAVGKAAWAAAVHYAFLDEPRTERVFGAPRFVDAMLVGYEEEFPFSVARRVGGEGDGEALAVCAREMFFQLCPLEGEGVEGRRGEEGGGVLAKL